MGPETETPKGTWDQAARQEITSPDRMTDATKNFTLHQTSFEGGNKPFERMYLTRLVEMFKCFRTATLIIMPVHFECFFSSTQIRTHCHNESEFQVKCIFKCNSYIFLTINFAKHPYVFTISST